jgi:hypothetical protein
MGINERVTNENGTINMMVDLETLGLDVRTAPILQIGAVLFGSQCPVSHHGIDFDVFISQTSNLEANRIPEASALKFWTKVHDVELMKNVLENPHATDLATALLMFVDFVKQARDLAYHLDMDFAIWSKPAKFDLVMLSHAMDDLDIDIPWQRREERDAYTIIGLMPEVQDKVIHDKSKLHDAKYDAEYQAAMVEYVAGHLDFNV